MFQIVGENAPNSKDVAKFVALINERAKRGDFFDAENEIRIARAPGRLDVMGGVADYSGALVLEMPIAEATFAALQKCVERRIKIVSLAGDGDELIFEMPLADFEQNGKPISYEAARNYFSQTPENHWAAYVAGVFLTLMRERAAKFQAGANVLIASDIPLGKGVSSSAALEAATMRAVCAAFRIEIEPRATALLCQTVENLIVGAPCGVMDQMTVVCGEANKLLALLCQPAEITGTIEIPEEIEFWGIDSGVRHAVTNADYGAVRVGAFMGYRIVAELAALKCRAIKDGFAEIEDSRWRGFLCNVALSEYEQFFAAQIPETIGGAEFIEKYQGISDSVTTIDREKVYPVKTPTAHAVYENFRVRVFAEILQNRINENNLKLLGEMMYQSHASYAACGLGEAGTNRLVELVRSDESKNLYGAKITGGGSGGTVAVLSRRGERGAAAIAAVAAHYERETGRRSYIFRGSSKGAGFFDELKLKNDW